jgi:lipopolysaccharide export system permease protein
VNKILYRYIAANVILPFVLSTTFFVLFLLTFQLFKVTALVIKKGVAISLVVELVYHIAVTFLPIAIPLSALFATIYVMGKMSEDSEIIVMRSFGLPMKDLFKPLLILGLFIGAATFAANSALIPRSKKEFKRIITILTSRGFVADIREGNFYTEIPNVTIFSDEVEQDGELLKNVFIHLVERKGKSEKVIFAKEGTLSKIDELVAGSPDIRLRLKEGNIVQVNNKREETEKILFQDYDFPIPSTDISGSFVTKDSMRSTKELFDLVSLTEEQRKEREISQKDFFKTQIEFWTRLNTPILCLLFIFLGFALGIQNARGKRRNSSSISLIVIIGYYALFFLGISLSKKGAYPPFLAIFLPTILGGVIGAYFYKKLEWVS